MSKEETKGPSAGEVGADFNEDMIRRTDLPKDVFGLVHDLAYDYEGSPKWYRESYRTRAKEILRAASSPGEARGLGICGAWAYAGSDRAQCKLPKHHSGNCRWDFLDNEAESALRGEGK